MQSPPLEGTRMEACLRILGLAGGPVLLFSCNILTYPVQVRRQIQNGNYRTLDWVWERLTATFWKASGAVPR